LYEVRNHLLFNGGAKVAQMPSPNHGGAQHPSLLVMHFTGSPSTEGAIRTLTDAHAKSRVSAHLVLSPEGEVTQLLPFNVIGWHAGQSSWHGRSACNNFSIGIEMVNSGLLGRQANGGYYDRLTRKPVAPEKAMIAKHKNGGGMEPWAIYPDPQVAAAAAIAKAIVKAYGITEIVGHDDVAPGRKIDPGPAWPMKDFVTLVFGAAKQGV